MDQNENGLPPLIQEILTEIVEPQLDELWTEHSCILSGIWVRHGDVPTVTAEELWASGMIEDYERSEALRNGEEPTAEEIKLYEERWLEMQLHGESDADSVPGYALAPVNDDDGHQGIALILCTGY